MLMEPRHQIRYHLLAHHRTECCVRNGHGMRTTKTMRWIDWPGVRNVLLAQRTSNGNLDGELSMGDGRLRFHSGRSSSIMDKLFSAIVRLSDYGIARWIRSVCVGVF